MSDSNDKTEEVRERLETDEDTEETTDSEPLLTLDSDGEGAPEVPEVEDDDNE